MPAYDFRCTECDLVFELTRSHGDVSPVACPACAGATKRVFSPVGVVFKGSGFHNTDYRPKQKSEESSPSGKDSCTKVTGSPACATCPAADQA